MYPGKNEYILPFNSLIHIKIISRRLLPFHIPSNFSKYPFTEKGPYFTPRGLHGLQGFRSEVACNATKQARKTPSQRLNNINQDGCTDGIPH